MTDVAEISAEAIYDHLTGCLSGDELMDPAGEETLAILDYRLDGLIHAHGPDVYPTRTLGRFRVVVEKVED
jgi:hypothetical protein